MLNKDTRKLIDDARDILVGKVPNPQSQVEQITIALIYKFMDDMDQESIEMGGNPSFFVGEYEKYAWSKIFDPRLGGFDMLERYGSALAEMNQNPHIPQLFRDIFKNAFLPYRDPATLKLFLKTINEFKYDHSEELGNAFEYLLSILGSQGEAGMFRTPRHIIDFIVQVVKPQAQETILDPACGTAGFLIAAYKYIMSQNTDKFPGDKLKHDERAKLMTNIKGYDISPDMTRLSLVNLYLHGFVNPLIHEYDTLTSEERWNEYYDVILANPPFMTPKGGIRPHKKFSVQCNRSEVLFVDYIAEHLTPHGRAGVIVPEGIIFQSSNAYKQLRKYLVDNNFLVAVVSLPAGVFNPYSGVKTSILIMDKALAKQTDQILFVKIENDGFNLGAQRTQIEQDDLPGALKFLDGYMEALRQGDLSGFEASELPCNGLLVKKEKLAENGDYNLTGEKYRESNSFVSNMWPMVQFSEIINNVKYPEKLLKSEFSQNGKYPIIDQSENFIAGYWNDENMLFKITKPVICFGDHTRALKYVDFDFVLGADGVKIIEPKDCFDTKFLYYLLKSIHIQNLGYSRHFKVLKDLKIPLPPLSVQEEIVAEIEGYQKIIDGAKQVVENYKPKIDIDPEWPLVELGEVCELERKMISDEKKELLYVGLEDVESETGIISPLVNSAQNNIGEAGAYYFSPKHILYGRLRPYLNKVAVPSFEGRCSTELIPIKCKSQILREYLWYLLRRKETVDYAMKNNTGSRMPRTDMNDLLRMLIPIPAISIQHHIVEDLNLEQEIIDQNKLLIKIFEQKIQNVINRVWGEEKNDVGLKQAN